MEIFLLLVKTTLEIQIWKECHEKRVNFERSFIPENLADFGISTPQLQAFAGTNLSVEE